jgi:S-adenosylmethionine hydrolase
VPATIVFLSDFGLDEPFVGVCHGVIARIAPDARLIDLSHGIPPQDVVRGAISLADAVPFMPPAVYLAVVDPGVGSERRAVAVETNGRSALVGPDNGILSLAWQALGGVRRAVQIASPDVLLEPVSETFHGRDVFAPAAAHLAAGRPIHALGPEIDPSGLARVAFPRPEVEPGSIRCEVLSVDRFGNVQLNVDLSALEAAGLAGGGELELRGARGSVRLRRVRTFAEIPEGELGILADSSGRLAIARNRGSAAEAVAGLGDPDLVLARPRPRQAGR